MSSLLVGQSGGPTAVINASCLGVIETALKSNKFDHVYGMHFGLSGIINEDFVEFKSSDLEDLQALKNTPSSILGSVRFKLSDDFNDPTYEQINKVFEKYDIKYFFYIGGNDSMDTCSKLNMYFKHINKPYIVIGVPKTIDNDLVETDHCPGYGTSAKFVSTVISEIYYDTSCYMKGRVTIVEIMGRDAGWLTAASSLASINGCGPDYIYLPEIPFNVEKFIKDVNECYDKKKRCLICVSEGIKDINGNYILKYRDFNNNDSFGHLQLGGVALVLSEIVSKELNLPVRAMELNLLQRCSSHIASKTDINEAYNCGKWAVKNALKGKTGVMICMKRISNNPYTIRYVTKPLDSIATLVKEFPKEFIINDNQISPKYFEYALPLIKGESKPKYVNGLPVFYKAK